jgi:5-methyltetrahydrofolate--homocysteine methyltransferase
MGEDGLPVSTVFRGASPMHHVQRDLIDPTLFYYHYRDHDKELRKLTEQIEPLFDDILKITCDSPAEAVQWGSNFDDMLTFPPFFEKEFVPWIRKAAEALGSRGKLVICHTDGENLGLMDLIPASGMHVAESICPYPMTKVPLDEYYRRWSDHLTLFGGIPSTIVIAENTPEDEFEAYLDGLFASVAPGRRMVVGIADQVPPTADFGRLIRIGERIEQEGRLPLEAGSFRPIRAEELSPPVEGAPQPVAEDEVFATLKNKVIEGDNSGIAEDVRQLLEKNLEPQDILNKGLIAAMEEVGRQFGASEVFIPEVLLSSRALTDAVAFLEPYLVSGADKNETKARVLIGTVKGDMHSIGKNMVVTMLKGLGFEVMDMGVDVSSQSFTEMVAEYKPDVLGLSALLTSTMPEMRNVITGLREQNLRDGVKVMVGGAPVSAGFAKDIGADGYAEDAVKAVALAKQLITGRE